MIVHSSIVYYYDRPLFGCSEGIKEALSSVVAGFDEQIKMKSILVRLHKEDQQDNLLEDEIDEEFVDGISYSRARAFACGDITLEGMTETELDALRGAFQMPTFPVDLIEAWIPWWESREVQDIRISKQGGYMVEPMQLSNSPSFAQSLPKLPTLPLMEFSRLTSRSPSDTIAYSLVDMLFWYCLELRLSNGDYECADEELLYLLLCCSTSFSEARDTVSGTNIREMSLTVIEISCKEGKKINEHISRGVAIGALKDVSKILSLGRKGVILALSDLYHIASRVQATCKKEGKKTSGRNLVRKSIRLMEKKLLYFLSWANEYVSEIAPIFSLELDSMYNELMATLKRKDDLIIP